MKKLISILILLFVFTSCQQIDKQVISQIENKCSIKFMVKKINKNTDVYLTQEIEKGVVFYSLNEKIKTIIANESPDVLFTHWPLDVHKDHQIASLLGIQTWVRLGKKFHLYFFEVCTGEQTFIFHPIDYVDIT